MPHRWEFVHDEVGYNYRLPNLNAALGCAQLEQLPGFLARKRGLAERYRAASRRDGHAHSSPSRRTAAATTGSTRCCSNDADVASATRCSPLPTTRGYHDAPGVDADAPLPMFADCPRAPLTVAERLEASLINVPSSARLAGSPR